MTFERFGAILLKRSWFIVICIVLAGLAAFGGTRLITPEYQSSALIEVAIQSNNNQADYTSLLASDQLVQTEAQLAVSDPVLRAVASQYPGTSVEQLLKQVSAAPKLNTQLFEIDVVDANPARAASLANSVAAALIAQQGHELQQSNIQAQQQLQQDLDTTRNQINAATMRIASLQGKQNNQAKVAVLQVQLNDLQQHYNQWETALAQLELVQAQNSDFLRISQPAQPTSKPVRPNVLLNTSAGLLGGLLLGMLLVLLLEQLDMRVRTPEAIAQLLECPNLGSIYRVNVSSRSELLNPEKQNLNSESYRILRTNIGFASIDKSIQTFLVTSATPSDGKSVIAANLAIFMAKAGKSTLLIDADLRRPVAQQLFQLPAEAKGLSNAILKLSKLPSPEEALCPQPAATPSWQAEDEELSLKPFMCQSGIANLNVMPSGPLPPNPSELLDSKVMRRFLQALATCGAEIVIFDAPPLCGLSDANILASKVDGVLFVADTTRANKAHLKQARAALTQAGAHVLGFITNKQRPSRYDTLQYYYYNTHHQDQDTQNTDKPHAVANLFKSAK